MTSPVPKPPKRTAGDAAHAATRAALSAIPLMGGPAVELFAYLVMPPLERRRNEWIEQVAATLSELKKARGIELERLLEGEEFFDTLLLAVQIGMRTAQETKREALRNAIMNSALADGSEQVMRHMFLNLIDSFSGWHLRILALTDAPPPWPDDFPHGYASVMQFVETHLPELRGHEDLYSHVWSDLFARGLIDVPVGFRGSRKLAERRTTPIGAALVRFIHSPL